MYRGMQYALELHCKQCQHHAGVTGLWVHRDTLLLLLALTTVPGWSPINGMHTACEIIMLALRSAARGYACAPACSTT